MPASDKSLAQFKELRENLKGKVPDTLLAKMEETFGEIEANAPDAVEYLGTYGMFRRDADRVYSEARAIQTTATEQQAAVSQYEAQLQAYETHLRENASGMTAAQLAEAQATTERVRAESSTAVARLTALEAKLKESNVFELFDEGLPAFTQANLGILDPETTTTIGEIEMPAQPPNTTPAKSATPANPMEFVTPIQMQQLVQTASMDAFRAGLTGSLQVGQLASELSTLTGKPVNPVELSNQWLTSGKPLDEFVETNFNLNQLRTAAEATARQTQIETEVTRRVQEETSKLRMAGATGNGAVIGAPRSPVFQGFNARQPTGVPATPTTPASPATADTSTLQQQQTQQVHNVSNRPQGGTVERVAAIIANGQYRSPDNVFDMSGTLFRGEGS